MLSKLAVVVCSTLAVAACTGAPADYAGSDALGPSVRQRMEGRQQFAVAATAPDGGSFVSAQIGGALAGDPRLVALPVVGGVVTTRGDGDGRVQLEQLEIELADVVLDEQQFPPQGLWLSGLRLRAAHPTSGEVAWSDGDQVGALRAEVDLVFDWGVVLADGELHPLATQTVRGVIFEIDIGRTGPVGIALSMGALADGVVWRWSSLVEVSDLGMELVAID